MSEDFDYKLIRSARRTLAVQVTNDGKIIVRAPLRLSIDKIEEFISRKHDWIASQVQSASEKCLLLPKLADGEQITILSESYVIRLCEGRKNAFLCDNTLFLPQNNPKKAVKSYLTKIFLPYISEKTRFFAEKFGFKYKEVKVASARKRWGSCSADNVIRYNIALALLPEKACDGVVAHELCHTLVKNHGKRFYAILYRVMPDYDKATLLRKEYGAFCSFFAEDV